MTTILVGTDTSAAADLAVEDAARLARDRDADLVLLYVRVPAEGARGSHMRSTDRSSDRRPE